MVFKYVTITGADNTIDFEQLLLLSEEFSFVEWGILCSESKEGDARFPTWDWIRALAACNTQGFNFSMHLCGKYARDVIFQNMLYFPPKCDHLFNRIQLNIMQRDFHKIDFDFLNNTNKLLDRKIEWILQYRGGLQDDKKIKEMEAYDCFSALYDISGGRGVVPQSWPKPFDNIFTGYAGGLTPNNLEKELDKIKELVEDSTIWIDMESGVRTKDKFDPHKVYDVLSICKDYDT